MSPCPFFLPPFPHHNAHSHRPADKASWILYGKQGPTVSNTLSAGLSSHIFSLTDTLLSSLALFSLLKPTEILTFKEIKPQTFKDYKVKTFLCTAQELRKLSLYRAQDYILPLTRYVDVHIPYTLPRHSSRTIVLQECSPLVLHTGRTFWPLTWVWTPRLDQWWTGSVAVTPPRRLDLVERLAN